MSIQVRAAKAAAGPTLPGYGSVRAIPRGMPRGDPGIFGDIWGGIKGAIGGAVRGFTGGATSPAATSPVPPTLPAWGGTPPLTPFQQPPQVEKPGVRGFIERTLPGGATGMMDDPEYRAGKRSREGYHWNKSGYFLRDGTWIQAGTKEVRNRRMNPLNPSAVKSSMRRLGRAKTAATDLNRVTIRKKKCAVCK